MHNWKITGFVASMVIVLSFPVFLVRQYWQGMHDLSQEGDKMHYTGGEACIECHKIEYEDWLKSHHAKAMDTANAETVLGDFNNAEFTSLSGFTSKFYTRDGKYYVHTRGVDGKMEEYQVAYTFGYTPLQQYLIPMEKGRFQTLNLTWNTDKGEWYDMVDTIYSGQEVPPSDWLYWTNNGQNWNGMCADCHSTELKKGYNPQDDTYHTTWTDINVNCESCHGPGSEHIKWANLPDIARPQDGVFGLMVKTSGIETKEYVELCARCHARRSAMGDLEGGYHDFLDYAIPQDIRNPYYHHDGQILEEDYVYASFLQSRMYYNDVRCNDCHNVHSGELVLDDNALCLQCHREADYDTYEHHFHKYAGETGDDLVLADTTFYVGEGALCVSCHMAGDHYMGVDFRRDHSMRIPRPDLTITTGSPNACNGCHMDESAVWAEGKIKDWYGIKKRSHYGSALEAGSRMEEKSLDELIAISSSDLYGTVVRSAALAYIARFHDERSLSALEMAMSDMESVVRHAGVQNYFVSVPERYMKHLIPMLNDPVKAVRIAAAFKLSLLPTGSIDSIHAGAYNNAVKEYIKVQEYTGDFSSSRHNLGIFYGNSGDYEKAAENYRRSILIDDHFYPAKMNLASVYNQLGNNEGAHKLLVNVVENYPEVDEAWYSLALLEAEMGDYKLAAEHLRIAGEKMPSRSRIFYNLGLIEQYLGNADAAEAGLISAYKLEPQNYDFLFALADHYIKQGEFGKAVPYAQKIVELYPRDSNGIALMKHLQAQLGQE